jgi:hypothetical protein
MLLLSLESTFVTAQSSIQIQHQVKLGDVSLSLGVWQKSDSNVSVRIDKLRWYLSLPTAGKKGSKAWLLDLADSASLYQQMSRPVNNKISLLFGIDSAIQVAGVGTGALDPLRGMYWTWQTGYVQWKMEGAIRVDGLESPLELHLGGFDGATKSQSMLSDYLIYPTTNSVIAEWDISPFLSEVVRRKKFGVMSPSPIAREYCRIIADGVSFHK